MKPLTAKQQRFISEYLKDLNGTQAAIRAGYSRHTAEPQASRLLRNVKVAAVLASRTQHLLAKAELTAQDVLDAIRRMVNHDVRTLFDPITGNIRPIVTLSMDEAAQIAGYEVIMKNAKAGDGKTDQVLKVKLKEQAKFVEMAAKYFGLLLERVEVEGDEEFIALLKSARDRGEKVSREAERMTEQLRLARKTPA